MNSAFSLAMVALDAAVTLLLKVRQVRAELQRDGEWTSEQELEYQQKLQHAFQQPHWKVEGQTT